MTSMEVTVLRPLPDRFGSRAPPLEIGLTEKFERSWKRVKRGQCRLAGSRVASLPIYTRTRSGKCRLSGARRFCEAAPATREKKEKRKKKSLEMQSDGRVIYTREPSQEAAGYPR